MTLSQSIDSYKKNEMLAHIELDDIIIKVVQEIGEMLESEDKLEELQKESGDAIVNILSASKSVGIIPELEKISDKANVSIKDLFIEMKKWTQAIQSIRGRYSRDNISKEEFKTITESFISHILTYSKLEKTLEEILNINSIKFSNRIQDYKAQINLKDYIGEYQDFPKAPVSFKDISPLLQYPEAIRYITFEFAEKAQGADAIVGLDAIGFLFGPILAEMLGIPFVMIRKKGKLPGEVIDQEYSKEYGIDTMEIQKDKILAGQKVVLIDDLLATGGTMDAAGKLIEKLGGKIHKILSVVQIDDEFCTQMREKYNLSRYQIESLVHYN